MGASGYAIVVSPRGDLLAHGNPEERSKVARGVSLASDPVVAALRSAPPGTPEVLERPGESGEPMLVVGVRVPDLGWMVLVEQPAREAFAAARRHERDLIAAISLALLIMLLAGLVWGRSLIPPIRELIRGTEAIAEGRLDERVASGRSRNRPPRRRVQPDGRPPGRTPGRRRKQERHAMFGRIAAGLVHDLSHPFKNIQNNCRLIIKMHDDPEYREMFRRTVDREFAQIKRVFEDLRNIARPMPMERFPLDLNTLAGDVAESMRANADAAGLTVVMEPAPGALYVEGDVFALSRVCRNIMMNAIEATAPNGAHHDRHGRRWRARDAARRGHRLRHPAGSPRDDVRGFQDDEAPRAGSGPRDHEEDRRSVGRDHHRDERGGRRHDVRRVARADPRRRRTDSAARPADSEWPGRPPALKRGGRRADVTCPTCAGGRRPSSA